MSGRGQSIGLGKSGAKRHKKVIKDSIQGVTKPALKRLFKIAAKEQGAEKMRMSGMMYDELRNILKSDLEDFVLKSIAITENDRRKTIMEKDVDLLLGNKRFFDKAVIPRAPMKRLIKEIAQDYKYEARFSPEAIDKLQLMVESRMLQRLRALVTYTKSLDMNTVMVGSLSTLKNLAVNLCH